YAVVILIIAVLIACFFKDTPEEMGFYSDGKDHPTVVEEEHNKITIRELLKMKDSWLVIVSFGILNFGILCITSFFVTTMLTKGVPAGVYVPALSIGAALGLVASFLLGVIDDRKGTPVASIVMCGFYILGFLGMILTSETSMLTIAMATVGYATITGGCSNLHSSINTYVFGQKNYLSVTRILAAIHGVIGAFASMYMGYFIAKGQINTPYYILIVAVIIAIIALVILARKPAYDSEEARKARNEAA
ncbi:MAG: MFS transporter, partial [Bacillota bacterium]|nr:MFS transporter [Bacillota bacterium]